MLVSHRPTACLHLLEKLSSFCVDRMLELARVFERLLGAFVFYQLKAILVEREVFTTTPYVMDSDGADVPRAPLIGSSSCKKRGRSTAMPMMIVELSIDLWRESCDSTRHFGPASNACVSEWLPLSSRRPICYMAIRSLVLNSHAMRNNPSCSLKILSSRSVVT